MEWNRLIHCVKIGLSDCACDFESRVCWFWFVVVRPMHSDEMEADTIWNSTANVWVDSEHTGHTSGAVAWQRERDEGISFHCSREDLILISYASTCPRTRNRLTIMNFNGSCIISMTEFCTKATANYTCGRLELPLHSSRWSHRRTKLCRIKRRTKEEKPEWKMNNNCYKLIISHFQWLTFHTHTCDDVQSGNLSFFFKCFFPVFCFFVSVCMEITALKLRTFLLVHFRFFCSALIACPIRTWELTEKKIARRRRNTVVIFCSCFFFVSLSKFFFVLCLIQQ